MSGPAVDVDDEDGESRHGLTLATCGDCRPREQVARAAPRPTTGPRSADDPIAPLSGAKDISVPVHGVEPDLGARTDWLIAQGYPHQLHPGGWVYLRLDGRPIARVRAVAARWREERPWRTGTEPGGSDDAEAGLVFSLEPATWEAFDLDLGDDAERMHSGFRYPLTDRNANIHHLMADDPIPEGDWDEPFVRNPS